MNAKSLVRILAVSVLPVAASGSAVSFTGTLDTPETVFETTFTLLSSSTVTFQTWGFGGGTNAAGQVISSGGFDSLIALFSGPAATATMYTDGSGNPLADADNLFNPPWSYVGNCPPAGTVAIGSDNDCGDDFMQAILAAGTYTLVLTDANYTRMPFSITERSPKDSPISPPAYSRPAIRCPTRASLPTETTR